MLIIGVLMGLLFVAFGHTRKFASSVAARDAVAAVKMGVSRFIDDYNFPPPLIRDWAQSQPRTVISDGAGSVRFAVYNFSADETANAAELLLLRTVGGTATNPSFDRRYSDRTLAVYLAGSCDVPARPADADAQVPRKFQSMESTAQGFYKPRADGTFEVPFDVRSGSAATTSRGGGSKYDSLIDLSKKSLTLYSFGRDPDQATAPEPPDGDSSVDAGKLRWVEVRDPRNVAIRYYRWVNGYSLHGGLPHGVRSSDNRRYSRAESSRPQGGVRSRGRRRTAILNSIPRSAARPGRLSPRDPTGRSVMNR